MDRATDGDDMKLRDALELIAPALVAPATKRSPVRNEITVVGSEPDP